MRLLRLRLAMTGCFVILLAALIPTSTLFGQEFKRALPGRTFSFPQDHFSHPEFKTEWWYYSGHLYSQEKKSYGYQLTFFRTGLTRETKHQKSKWSIHDLYFAHLALTDESKKKFDYREKVHRGSLGEAGATPLTVNAKTFRVWIEDWWVEGRGPGLRDHHLKAGDQRYYGIPLEVDCSIVFKHYVKLRVIGELHLPYHSPLKEIENRSVADLEYPPQLGQPLACP